MSQVEINEYNQYSALFTLVDGVLAPITTANFNGNSRVLSIVRTALNLSTAVGVPHVAIVAPTGAGAGVSSYKLGVYSSTAVAGADVATYRVFWVNQYNPSPNYVQGGATIGAQFPA